MEEEDWTQNVEVIWDENYKPIFFIINGEGLTVEQYHDKYPLYELDETDELLKTIKYLFS